MLYDPKWEKPPAKADPFSLAAVIAWLESQPADQEYDYFSVDGCLACCYFQSLGHARPWGNSMSIVDGGYAAAFESVENYWQIAGSLPWTFGAALERAREVARHA